MRNLRWLSLGGACVTLVVLQVPEASAGWRELEVLGSNMTPNEHSSEASKKCVERIRNTLSNEDVKWNHTGETALRKLVGREDKSESFMGWSSKDLAQARTPGEPTYKDTVLLIDCRPEEKSLDILIGTGDDGRTTIRLRQTELSVERLVWVSKEISRHAWVNFTP